jgi:miniconductance mechanosensitive channel
MSATDYNFDFQNIGKKTHDLLIKWGVSDSIADYINLLGLSLVLAIVVYLLHYVLRRLLRIALIRITKRTKIDFFHHLLENRFAHFVALTTAVALVKSSIPVVFYSFPSLIAPLNKLTEVYLVIIIIWLIISLIRSGADSLRKKSAFKSKPIESYMQVIRIILFFIGAVIIFSNLTGKSPLTFFTAMGAISAVLLLMFKDTIMGFVASIQVSTNDTVRIGDWITMAKYGADGDVVEINLTTVKVQNFDKTITTIPTYSPDFGFLPKLARYDTIRRKKDKKGHLHQTIYHSFSHL